VIYLSVATETQCTSSDIITLNLRETPYIFVMIDPTYLRSLYLAFRLARRVHLSGIFDNTLAQSKVASTP